MPTDRTRGAVALVVVLVAVGGASIHAAPVRGQGSEPDEPFAGASELRREELVAAVLDRNPSLEAARQALRAANARPAQAAALDPLNVAYGLAPRSVGSSAVPFGQELEVAQMLPYPGKRRLRSRAAVAAAEVAGEEVATLSLEVATRASLLFDDLYVAHRALEVNAEHVALVEEFQRVATARYAAGLASQQDPLQAEFELAHLLHDGVLLRSQKEVFAAGINALLHLPPGTPLPPPSSPTATAAARLETAAELEAEAFARRPELRRIAAIVAARRAELGLAKLSGRPDFGVMTSYNSMWSDPEHRAIASVSLILPLWRSRVRAAVDEAEARLAEADSERMALEDDVRREVFQAATRWREAHHVLDLFRSRLLPAASDQVQAALAGFESGRNDFLTLIQAERGLRGVKLGHHEALADLHRRRAELDRALGRAPAPASRSAGGTHGGNRGGSRQ